MRLGQRVRRNGLWTTSRVPHEGTAATQLALVFGPGSALEEPALWDELRTGYPGARIVACSTAGEIAGAIVSDDSLVVTEIALEYGAVAVASVTLAEHAESAELGRVLVTRLPAQGLRHVLVLSDGLRVNGTSLVAGITAALSPGVAVTGGLSGDGARFERTQVYLDRPDDAAQVVAIGFYGERLRAGYGSVGGWDPFGPERRITRSRGNVLYELDGEPALALYKRYLGEHAASLPSSGLHFPLAVRDGTGGEAVVRTILGVDEAAGTLTFAGDVPEGFRARLMRSNVERLVDGATSAASSTTGSIASGGAELAILISCVGRKLVLKQRTEEEVESVVAVLGEQAVVTGFYSYGEIGPFVHAGPCGFHNQTMTVTTLSEV